MMTALTTSLIISNIPHILENGEGFSEQYWAHEPTENKGMGLYRLPIPSTNMKRKTQRLVHMRTCECVRCQLASDKTIHNTL
mmetsp:Transcript_25429/g.32371  ORF Transcript_25429/g.32371 Transcript_25429/m.32371 type:complete len:82 (+) Transcript_25429:280-525(+)